MLDYFLHAVDIAAVLGILVAFWNSHRDNDRRLHDTELALNRKVTEINTKVDIIFRWFEKKIVNEKGEN